MTGNKLSEPLTAALKILVPLLDGGGGNAGAFPWAFTGSLGMALQGMALEIHDIDMQTDAAGAYAIGALLKQYTLTPVYLRESEQMRSYYGAFEIGGVKVEVMGDCQNRLAGGAWSPAPALPRLIRWARLETMRLPVMDLEYECEAYLRLGRIERSQAVRRFLDG